MKPDNLSHIKWVAWEEMVYTYFKATKISRGVPLLYVLYKNLESSRIIIDRGQYIMQNSPLHSNIFPHNTKKVLAIIKELTVDTDAETWMKRKRCGQEAMLEFQKIHDGK